MHLPAFFNNTKLQDAVRLICLALVIVMVLVAAAVYRANLGQILLFAGFILCYVQLPGQLLLRLAGLKPDHFSTLLAGGFFTGWAFVVLQYFVTELIHTNILLYVLGPVCTAVYLLLLYRDRSGGGAGGNNVPQNRPLDQKYLRHISPAFCIFVTVSLLYAMLLTQYLYLSPTVDQTITMNPDKGFHLGLINSLSHGWPLECPWFAGLYYNYHIFTELLYSVPVRLFGMTADTLLFTCGPYMTVYAFGISLYAFFRELSTKKTQNLAGLYCLAVLLSNIFIARGPSRSIAFLFIFRNENVAGYGVSCALVLVILIRYWYRAWAAADAKAGTLDGEAVPGDGSVVHSARTIPFGAGTSWRLMLPALAVLMLNTGIKGPFGLVIVASMWGTFVLGLLLRQMKFKTILPLLLFSFGFYVIYSVVLGSKGQSASAGESLIALGTIVDITFYKAPLIALMKSFGLPGICRYAVLLGVFTVCLLTAFFLPFVIGYIRELVLVLTRRRSFDFTRVLVYAACLVGYLALLLLNYHGHSQIYFGFVTVFFAPMIAFWFFEDMAENRGMLMQVLRILFIAGLVLSAIGLGSFLLSQTGEAKEAADPNAGGSKWKSMSHEEYEAMRWIDKNTPKDALLATDRYYTVNPEDFDVTDRWDNRYFLYADYSNRICYLAGAGYNLPARDWKKREERIAINDRFYDAADPQRGELARSLGIDYVVVSKRFTDCGLLENDDFHRVFSNDDVDVYEVIE